MLSRKHAEKFKRVKLGYGSQKSAEIRSDWRDGQTKSLMVLFMVPKSRQQSFTLISQALNGVNWLKKLCGLEQGEYADSRL
jgi:hypothetical protein